MRVLALLAALLPGAALAHGAGRLEPIRPGALAVGPNGALYVADTAGNRVLARRPDGGFRVVATGLRSPAGMAVAADGTTPLDLAANDKEMAALIRRHAEK